MQTVISTDQVHQRPMRCRHNIACTISTRTATLLTSCRLCTIHCERPHDLQNHGCVTSMHTAFVLASSSFVPHQDCRSCWQWIRTYVVCGHDGNCLTDDPAVGGDQRSIPNRAQMHRSSAKNDTATTQLDKKLKKRHDKSLRPRHNTTLTNRFLPMSTSHFGKKCRGFNWLLYQ